MTGEDMMTADQYSAYRHWLIAFDNLEAYLNRMLGRYGLSMSEYRVLVVLSEAPNGRLRMSDLANDAHHSPSRSSHTITRMETRGWVKRLPHANDRRVIYVSLTPAGADLLTQARPPYQSTVKRIFVDAVGIDNIPQLDSLMRRVITATSGSPSPAE